MVRSLRETHSNECVMPSIATFLRLSTSPTLLLPPYSSGSIWMKRLFSPQVVKYKQTLQSNLLEKSSEEKDLHTFHPGQDWWLSWIEFWIVFLIGLGVICAISCLILWSFFGCFQDIHDKLLPAKTDIDNHWRVGLVIFPKTVDGLLS